MKIKLMSLLLILSALFGCAILGDRTVNITEEQIQQKLNEKLSVPFSLLKIFDVNLSNSIVKFDQETGRMHIAMDTNLSSALFNESAAGQLDISGKLRFDAASNSIVLDAPKVENFNLDGLDGKQASLFNALAKVVGEKMLTGLALYTVKPGDLTVGTTQYTPKDMQITDKGLQLTLSPN